MPRIAQRVQALAPSLIREMFRRKKPTSLDLSLGEPALPTDTDLLDRAFARLRKGPHGYTENAGLMELRELIAKHYALSENPSGEDVIITVGSEEALFLAFLSVLDPGDAILVPVPGYPAYPGLAGLVGVEAVPYSVDCSSGLVPQRSSLEAAWTPQTRAVLINAPSNPFGTIPSPKQLSEIVQFCDEQGLTIISDEIYGELVYEDSQWASICTQTDNAILVGGLSKSCALTGHRLGYLIADPTFAKKATLAHQLTVTCAPRFAQLLAHEIFSEPERLRAHVPFYEAARDAARAASTALPEDAPLMLGDGAFYAVVDVSKYTADPLDLANRLLDSEDVVVVPGTAFGTAGDWFVRLSYAAGADAIRDGIHRIANFLEK